MKLQKKHLRLLAYAGILGGCAVLSLVFFTVSQFQKAKYQASDSVRLMCKGKYDQLADAYKEDNPTSTKTVLEDDSESNKYNAAALYWNDNYTWFSKETDMNSAAYIGTAIPAYLFSMSTLVAFGLILKHAEQAKEKEDEQVVKK